MATDLDALLDRQHCVATSAQLLRVMSRRSLAALLRTGELAVVWPGVYGRGEIDRSLRLRGLDLRAGESVATCLSTAAAVFGFDTEDSGDSGDSGDLHVINPPGHQLRASDGLFLHRRNGAPLVTVDGRPTTESAWTAVEVARELRRPRALATLDAALRSATCDGGKLLAAAAGQAGRRGIVNVRELIPLATGKAESPMESEARLVMHDAGLAPPVLQLEIVDRNWRRWRVDFAWPYERLVVEYDGFDWHSDPEAFRRDREKRAALREVGWTMLSIVSDDVRRRSREMVRRIEVELAHARAA